MTASESIRRILHGFSSSFSGCTPGTNILEREWGWRFARKPSSGTADRFGWSPREGPAPLFSLVCPRSTSTVNLSRSSPEILHVEDNPGDIRLVAEGFAESIPSARLTVATDAEEAIRFLRRKRPYEGAARPDLVLLDINLPSRSGLEVLAELKQDP